MKRDLDLIRAILKKVESLPMPAERANLEIEGYDFPTIAFHMELLIEAGYLHANVVQSGSGQYVAAWPFRLTWEGCEFLELSQNEKAWTKTKSLAKDKAISMSFAIFTEVLKFCVKEALGMNQIPNNFPQQFT